MSHVFIVDGVDLANGHFLFRNIIVDMFDDNLGVLQSWRCTTEWYSRFIYYTWGPIIYITSWKWFYSHGLVAVKRLVRAQVDGAHGSLR